MKIFDCHIHICDVGRWDLRLDFNKLDGLMKEYGIKKAVLIPLLVSNQIDPSENIELMQQCEGNNDFYFFYWFNTDGSENNIQAHLDFIDKYRDLIAGVKYHPTISQIKVNERRLFPIFEWCGNHGKPILVHTGRLEIGLAAYVKDAAEEFKNATFIIAHLGGQVFDRIMDCINFYDGLKLDNVFFDSSQTTHSVLLERAVNKLGSEKILFGSDMPFLDMGLVLKTFDRLSHLDKERIFWKNAIGIFGN